MKPVAINRRQARGFSMVEVLVSMVIASIGLLGFAKLQAAVLSNSQTARTRSLVAVQTASLAAAMNANRAYWASTEAPARVSMRGGEVSDPDGVLSAEADCMDSGCTPAELAADDLQNWARTAQTQFPDHEASVACTAAPARPVQCVIDVSWSEKTVAINRSTAANAAAMTSRQQYTLYVEP